MAPSRPPAPRPPPGLDAACLRAIVRRPGDRHPSMAEFAADLGRFLARPAAAAGPTPPSTGTAPPPPAEDTEALAAQVFADLIGGEVTTIRDAGGETPLWQVFHILEEYRDFDLRAEVLRDAVDSSGGLVFRYSPGVGSHQGYSVGLGRSQGDGAGNSNRAAAGAISLWTMLPGRNMVYQHGAADSPPPGRWFPVELQVRGGRFRARVANGRWVEAVDPDREHPTGQVGFSAMGGPEGSILKIRKVEIRPVE